MQVEHVLDASYGDASISEAQTLSIEVLCEVVTLKNVDRRAADLQVADGRCTSLRIDSS